MKKTLTGSLCLLFLLLSVSSVSAQIHRIIASSNVITRDVPVENYDCIELIGIPNVVYTQSSGSGAKLQLVASDNLIDFLVCEVVDGKLIIKMKEKVSINAMKDGDLSIITSSSALYSATLNGAGNIHIKEKLTTNSLNLTLNGAGDITANIVESNGKVTATVNGSGDILISKLSAPSTDLSVNGAGDMTVGTLATNTATTVLNGAGDIVVRNANVKETLFPSLNGAGDLTVSGIKAKSVDAKLSGAGDMKLSGAAITVELLVRGSGDLSARNLEGETVTVTVVDSGDASCWVTETLECNISKNGSVGYRGRPRKIINNGKEKPHRL